MGNRMSNIATPMPQIRARFTSKLGIPLSGCKVYTYEPNSNIPKTTWVDIDKTVENTNPILLDAAGEADIFLNGLYRIVVKDRFGFVVYDVEKTGTHTELDASFVTHNGLTQQKINDGLTSIEELLSVSSPKNGNRQFVKGLQGGWFEYVLSKSGTNDGVMIFNGWARITLETVFYPEWAGCVGNKITDDHSNFQKLINFLCPTAWDTSIAAMNTKSAGSEIILSRPYLIKDTLWLPAWIKLIGATKLGFYSDSVPTKQAIISDFTDPLKPAISSSNYTNIGLRVAYDATTNGASLDSGTISATHGITLKDFSILTKAGTRGFMGVRLQNSPQSEVDLYIKGFDYSFMANACWSSKFNIRSLHYKCGTYLRSNNNSCFVEGYNNTLKDAAPLAATNLINFFDGASDTDTTLSDADKTFGFVSYGSFGLAAGTLITEANSVGTVICNGSANIQCLYTEKNTITGYCSFTNYSSVVIGNFVGAADQTCMLLGANSKTRILSSHKTSTIGAYFSKFSRYNSELYAPASLNAWIRGIQYMDFERTLYVDAANGNDTYNGLATNYALKTLGAALSRIAQYGIADKNIAVKETKAYQIILAAGSYTVDANKVLYGDLHITTSLSSGFPTVTFTSHIDLDESSNLVFTNINVIKPDVSGSNENACVWSKTGKNSVTVNGGSVTLQGGGGLVYPDYNGCSEISLLLNKSVITGTTLSQLVQTNFGNYAPHIVNFSRAGGSIDANITSRSDKGISVPTAWQGKILGL